jgi:hypothetical protein
MSNVSALSCREQITLQWDEDDNDVRFALDQTRWAVMLLVHWNNLQSMGRHVTLTLGHIISDCYQTSLCSCSLILDQRRSKYQFYKSFGLSRPGLIPRSNALEAAMLSITPPMGFHILLKWMYQSQKVNVCQESRYCLCLHDFFYVRFKNCSVNG